MEPFQKSFSPRQPPRSYVHDGAYADGPARDPSPPPRVRKLPRLSSWQPPESHGSQLFMNHRDLPPPSQPSPDRPYTFDPLAARGSSTYQAPSSADPHTHESTERAPATPSYHYGRSPPPQSGMCFGGGQAFPHDLQPRPVADEKPPYLISRAAYPYARAPTRQHAAAAAYYDPPSGHAPYPRQAGHTAVDSSEALLGPPARRMPQMASSGRNRIADFIPNLLGEHKAHLVPNIEFSLRIRQQPERVRACGFADRDRRAIDPPPILELVIEGQGLTREDIRQYQMHKYMAYCIITDDKGNDRVMMDGENARAKRIIGELSATTFFGKDDRGVEGCFFSFSDLSVRTTGDYRLSFSTIMWPGGKAHAAGRLPRVAEVNSGVFRSYNAKSFPGMTESSALARALKDQGCNIPVRKGNDRGKASPRGPDDEDEET